jgi:hypothetical protein
MTVACPPVLTDRVRAHCAAVAASARHVTIDPAAEVPAGGVSGLDDALHFLDGPPEAVARYVLILDAVNFGSGWFGELGTTTDALTERLTAQARAEGPWTAAQLRALDARAVADTLGLPEAHPLTAHYAEALTALGAFLGERTVLGDLLPGHPTAEAFAQHLADGMPYFADRGFYKRAQITANDLQLARVADFPDVDRLTVFADNLLPHVLRLDGVLAYSDELAALVDGERELPAGSVFEQEVRACAVHACEGLARRLEVPPRRLDNWLWNRGTRPPYTERPAHVTHTVFY